MAENNELEKTLWATADKLRSNMDAVEYYHVALGLVFSVQRTVALISWRSNLTLLDKLNDPKIQLCTTTGIDTIRWRILNGGAW